MRSRVRVHTHTHTHTRASRGNVSARCYRHIDFTPEDADKRGIDFSQTRTAPLRLHEISFKYEWSRSRASPGLGSRAELRQEEPRSPRSVAHHRFPGLRPTSTEDRSVRSSINRDQGSIGIAVKAVVTDGERKRQRYWLPVFFMTVAFQPRRPYQLNFQSCATLNHDIKFGETRKGWIKRKWKDPLGCVLTQASVSIISSGCSLD